MKKFIVSQTNKNLNKFFGLSKKNLNFTWQAKEPHNKEKMTYLNEEEREKFEKRKISKRMKEDYRLEIFDIGLHTKETVVIDDEIFGSEQIQKKLFENASIVEIYKHPNYTYKNTLLNKRLSYLKEMVPDFKLENQHINDQLETINSLILKSIENRANMLYSDWEAIYNKTEVAEEMMKLGIMVKTAIFSDIPNILLKLSFELGYTTEYVKHANLFNNIEDLIHLNFHLFNTKQLALINFALTTKMPKKGSLFLRKRIKDVFLQLNFDNLVPYEIMIIYTAFRNDKNCDKMHRKCLHYFLTRDKDILKLAEINKGLPLDVLFTFANNKLDKRYRRKFKERDEVEIENEKMVNKYFSAILKNFSYFSKEDILRIIYCIEKLKMKQYDEIYFKIEKYVISNINNYHYSEISSFLFTAAKSNENRSIFSRNFWSKIPIILKKNGLLNFKESSSCIELLSAFASMKAIDLTSFQDLFGDQFYELINNSDLSIRELGLLGEALCYLKIYDEQNDSLRKYFKIVIYKLSKKDEWIPIFDAPRIAIFLNYIKLTYDHWNLNYIENLMYHSEKRMSGYKLRDDAIKSDYSTLNHILTGLDTNFISFLPFKNFYILDYVIEERRLCLNLIKESDLLFSHEGEISEIQPRFFLKNKILLKEDWTICLVDFREFENLKDQSKFLKERLEESYKLTFEKSKKIHYERRLEILNFSFENSKYMYHDRRYKEMNRRREIVENLQQKFNQQYKD